MEDIKIKLQKEIEGLLFKKVGFDESILKSKLLDSISVIDLAVSIEEAYGIEIQNTDINEANFDTINKISDFIQSKL